MINHAMAGAWKGDHTIEEAFLKEIEKRDQCRLMRRSQGPVNNVSNGNGNGGHC